MEKLIKMIEKAFVSNPVSPHTQPSPAIETCGKDIYDGLKEVAESITDLAEAIREQQQ